mmetsp:Transcript_36396/g.87517  ORF Transcript_36396/g.87517 Transcript_36396/m.87517 type:complete len:110 (+) Transcript_36396:27-356(+)
MSKRPAQSVDAPVGKVHCGPDAPGRVLRELLGPDHEGYVAPLVAQLEAVSLTCALERCSIGPAVADEGVPAATGGGDVVCDPEIESERFLCSEGSLAIHNLQGTQGNLS